MTLHTHQRGASLIIALLVLVLVAALAVSVLFSTQQDYKSSVAYRNTAAAVAAGDSAIEEVLWRLNTASNVTVNDLVNYDPTIEPDEFGLLTNGLDDDGDGDIDEPDELNLVRDWQVRILLSRDDPAPGPPWEVADADPVLGPPWGSQLVVPTIQSDEDWLAYSTGDPANSETLSLRFKLDTDTDAADSEGDGPEIVFFDPNLARSDGDDHNVLTQLVDGGDKGEDGPYNITLVDMHGTHAASGAPVLLLESTGRFEGPGLTSARNRFQAEIIRTSEPLIQAGICGCEKVEIKESDIASLRGRDAEYGDNDAWKKGPKRSLGHVGSNADLKLQKSELEGDALAGHKIDVDKDSTVTGVAKAGDKIKEIEAIDGDVLDYRDPAPRPCACDRWDLDAEISAAKLVNDNGLLAAPYDTEDKLDGSIIMDAGTYYFEQIDLKKEEEIQIGIDSDADGIVDLPPAGPVLIIVKDSVKFAKESLVNQQLGRPGDLHIHLGGSGASLDFEDEVEFNGFIYAPEADVYIGKKTKFFGALIGAKVELDKVDFWFDEDLMDLERTPGPYRVIAWREQ